VPVTVKTAGIDTFGLSCENNQINDIMTVWEWSKFAYVLYPPCVIATTIRHWERIKSSATGSVKESTVHEAVCSLTELGSNAEIAPIPLPLYPFYLYSLWCVSQIKKRIRFLARFLTRRKILKVCAFLRVWKRQASCRAYSMTVCRFLACNFCKFILFFLVFQYPQDQVR
jgi:hypothetical protein